MLKEICRTSHLYQVQTKGQKAEQWVFLCPDIHWDNPHCNRDLLKRHLDEAVKMGARIVFVRGIYRVEQIEAAVLEMTGLKRLPRDWKKWMVVGLADEQSRNIVSGMPFSPPDDRPIVYGFRRLDGKV